MSEDILEGSRIGRSSPSSASTEIADPEPSLEDEVVEEFVTESPEDVIAIGETEDLVDDQVPSLPVVDQSYRQVAFQQPDVKFAVCSLASATALFAKLH